MRPWLWIAVRQQLISNQMCFKGTRLQFDIVSIFGIRLERRTFEQQSQTALLDSSLRARCRDHTGTNSSSILSFFHAIFFLVSSSPENFRNQIN